MAIDVSPRFTLALRGYDKDEVDDYLEALTMHAGEVDEALQLEQERARHLDAQLAALHNRVAELEGALRDDMPHTARALGERVTTILSEAEAGAVDTLAQARAQAELLLAEARDEAETLRRQAAMYANQANETLAGAQREAQAVAERMESEARSRASAITAEAEGRARRRHEQIEAWAQEVITRTQAEQARLVEEFLAIRRRHEAEVGELVGRRDETVATLQALQAALARAVERSVTSRPAMVPVTSAPPTASGVEAASGSSGGSGDGAEMSTAAATATAPESAPDQVGSSQDGASQDGAGQHGTGQTRPAPAPEAPPAQRPGAEHN